MLNIIINSAFVSRIYSTMHMAEEKQDVDYIPLACTPHIRYAVSMKSHTIRLKEPLIIPKKQDENFLFMVDSSLVQLWPQMVCLCEKEKLSLRTATGRMVTLDPLHLGMRDWYFYKMRCLLRAYFLGDEVMTLPVEVVLQDGNRSRFTFEESRRLGTMLLHVVQLA